MAKHNENRLSDISPPEKQSRAVKLHSYTAYGYSPVESNSNLLGYNGELRQPATGWYLLGNGYRAYNPTMMRFSIPDSLSPFDAGGLNSYTYVTGDPVNYSDPDGHFRLFGRYRTFSGNAKSVHGNFVYMAKHPQHKGKRAITVVTHGSTGAIASARGNVNAEKFVSSVKKAGFDTRKYDVHIIACNSANATANNKPSFIQQVSDMTGMNAFGYVDKVFTQDSINFKRSGSGSTWISTRVYEKESSFSRTPGFNFQRAKANPQELGRAPLISNNRIRKQLGDALLY